MAWWLRALDALLENPGWTPNTHKPFSPRGPNALFLPFQARGKQIDKQTKYPYILKNNMLGTRVSRCQSKKEKGKGEKIISLFRSGWPRNVRSSWLRLSSTGIYGMGYCAQFKLIITLKSKSAVVICPQQKKKVSTVYEGVSLYSQLLIAGRIYGIVISTAHNNCFLYTLPHLPRKMII